MTVNYLVCNIEGQKRYLILELLPLQGVSFPSDFPMAMPWAMSLLPLRGAIGYADSHFSCDR